MNSAKITAKARIRWAIRRDMGDMLALYDLGGQHPMTEEQLLSILRQRNVIGLVAELECGTIVACAAYELFRDRIHIINLAVDPDLRRMGIGRQIIAKLVDKLSRQRRYRLTLNCRETNLGAQMFYRSCGLKATRIRPGFYEDTGEDAFAFEYRLPAEREV